MKFFIAFILGILLGTSVCAMNVIECSECVVRSTGDSKENSERGETSELSRSKTYTKTISRFPASEKTHSADDGKKEKAHSPSKK